MNRNHTGTTNHTVTNAAVEAAGMKTLPIRDVKVSALSLPLSPSHEKVWVVTCVSLSTCKVVVVHVTLSMFAIPDTRVLASSHM